jgi:nucleotide-binding universal stress UspA family protein
MISVSKILAAVDFSPGSQTAVECALVLARALHSTVTLLHVCRSPDAMSTIVPGADCVVDAEDVRTSARRFLEEMRSDAQSKADVEIALAVHEGSPDQEILALAQSDRFDMIVMGTHGRTGLRHVLMGSVAEVVVRHATCLVLTIRLPSTEREGEVVSP